MFPATTKQGGMCYGFPDTCKTPTPGGPVPTPYPNFAQPAQARVDTVSRKVKICKKKVLTKKSVIPLSTGDEAGNLGGVISNMFKGQAKFRRGSNKVKVEGHPIVYLGCQTAQNGNNANVPVGNHVAPSQTKVFIGG